MDHIVARRSSIYEDAAQHIKLKRQAPPKALDGAFLTASRRTDGTKANTSPIIDRRAFGVLTSSSVGFIFI